MSKFKGKPQPSKIHIGVIRLFEIASVAAIIVAIYMLMALSSFNPNDPSWTQTAWETTVTNTGGSFGALLSDGLLFTFGSLAFAVPFFLAIGMLLVTYRRKKGRLLPIGAYSFKIIGVVLLILTCCGLANVNFNDLWYFPAGGVIGDLVQGVTQPIMDPVGATLFLIFFWGVGFSLLIGQSWLTIAEVVGRLFSNALSGVLNRCRKDGSERLTPFSEGLVGEENLPYTEKLSTLAMKSDVDEHADADDVLLAVSTYDIKIRSEETYAELEKIYQAELEQKNADILSESEVNEPAEDSLKKSETLAIDKVALSSAEDMQVITDFSVIEKIDDAVTVNEEDSALSVESKALAEQFALEQAQQEAIYQAAFAEEKAKELAEERLQQETLAKQFADEQAQKAMDYQVALAAQQETEREKSRLQQAALTQQFAETQAKKEADYQLALAAQQSKEREAARLQQEALAKQFEEEQAKKEASYQAALAEQEALSKLLEEQTKKEAEYQSVVAAQKAMLDAKPVMAETVISESLTQSSIVSSAPIFLPDTSESMVVEKVVSAVEVPLPEVPSSEVNHASVEKETTEEAAFLQRIRDAQKEQDHLAGLDNPFLVKQDHDLPKPTTPMPTVDLLQAPKNKVEEISQEELEATARLVEMRLAEYKIKARVAHIFPGPVITRYELELAPGVKVSRISGLSKDLARALAASAVRVVEVIPGKPYVGLELPNEKRETVYLSEVIGSDEFENVQSPLPIVLGKDIAGKAVLGELSKMPHLLVAGTTGSGKSVGVNVMIMSLLFKCTPEECRFIMIDPKMLELSIYEGIPHLLTPVVTDMKDANTALRWCVGEMEHRYKLLSKLGVRDVSSFNDLLNRAREGGHPILDPLWSAGNDMSNAPQPLENLPRIVVIVDEFADLMLSVGKKVEELIARLAQKARAAGIHLILATQRPSVDVITGVIKANIPTRMAFTVSTKTDSRTILDQGGAESLLGMGDMLYLPSGQSHTIRVHGAFASDDDVHNVVNDWRARGRPQYVEDILNPEQGSDSLLPGEASEDDLDQLFDEVVAYIVETRKVSVSSVQRRFKIGFNRASRIVEQLENRGIVTPPGHNNNREVLAPKNIEG